MFYLQNIYNLYNVSKLKKMFFQYSDDNNWRAGLYMTNILLSRLTTSVYVNLEPEISCVSCTSTIKKQLL